MSDKPEESRLPVGTSGGNAGEEVLEAEDLFPPPYPERLAGARQWVEQLIGPLDKIRVAERMQAALRAAQAALWDYLLSEGAVKDEEKPEELGP
jgi:hypothetical protein